MTRVWLPMSGSAYDAFNFGSLAQRCWAVHRGHAGRSRSGAAMRPQCVAGGEAAVAALQVRLAELVALLQCDMAVVLGTTPSGDFEVTTAVASPPVPPTGLWLPGGVTSICGFAALQEGAVIFDNVIGTARFRGAQMATTFGAVSSLVVALRDRDILIGVLSVHSRAQRSFTSAEAQALERAAGGFAVQLIAARSTAS